MAELEQLKQGLKELGVLSLLHSHQKLLKPLFLANEKPQLTASSILNISKSYGHLLDQINAKRKRQSFWGGQTVCMA